MLLAAQAQVIVAIELIKQPRQRLYFFWLILLNG
jgi:hypothetical protein